MQHSHAAAQPPHERLYHNDITWMNRAAVSNAFDAHEVNELLAVLGFRKDHDRADLRDSLGQNRRRQYRRLAGPVSEVALVEGHVLDAHDAFVGLELDDPIDQQEWIPVGENPLDRRIVERQRQIHK